MMVTVFARDRCRAASAAPVTTDGPLPETHDFFRRNPDQYLYMHRQVIPMLRELGTGEDDIRRLFVDNPRRFLAGR